MRIFHSRPTNPANFFKQDEYEKWFKLTDKVGLGLSRPKPDPLSFLIKITFGWGLVVNLPMI